MIVRICPSTQSTAAVISFCVRVPVLSVQITVALPRVSTAVSLPDERVALDHLLHPQCEADGDDGGQALGNGGDGEAHRDEEHHEDVAAFEDPHHEHHGARGKRGHAQPSPHLGELLLQRRVLVLVLLQHPGDEPDLRVPPGARDDAAAPPVGDGGPHPRHGALLRDRRVVRQRGLRALFHRRGLPGERGLLDPEVHRLGQPQSAGTMLPASRRTTSPATRVRAGTCSLLPDLMTRASGAAIVRSEASARSALYSCTTPMTALRMTSRTITMASSHSPSTSGYHRGAEEEENEEILELVHEVGEQGRGRLLGQLVRPAGCQPPGRLLRRQPAGEVGVREPVRRRAERGSAAAASRPPRRGLTTSRSC